MYLDNCPPSRTSHDTYNCTTCNNDNDKEHVIGMLIMELTMVMSDTGTDNGIDNDTANHNEMDESA